MNSLMLILAVVLQPTVGDLVRKFDAAVHKLIVVAGNKDLINQKVTAKSLDKLAKSIDMVKRERDEAIYLCPPKKHRLDPEGRLSSNDIADLVNSIPDSKIDSPIDIKELSPDLSNLILNTIEKQELSYNGQLFLDSDDIQVSFRYDPAVRVVVDGETVKYLNLSDLDHRPSEEVRYGPTLDTSGRLMMVLIATETEKLKALTCYSIGEIVKKVPDARVDKELAEKTAFFSRALDPKEALERVRVLYGLAWKGKKLVQPVYDADSLTDALKRLGTNLTDQKIQTVTWNDLNSVQRNNLAGQVSDMSQSDLAKAHLVYDPTSITVRFTTKSGMKAEIDISAHYQ